VPLPALVIGTAGHIDHGKTSLVRALTGVDLDRSPEEKARGITIQLGFVGASLPSGRRVSFVDVPGHERLVRTMVAGACGLDAALLCVSAVEGVMPQTREHLAILQLLGLRSGLVVLTCPDLVDADGLELARMDVEEAVVGTFLEGAPVLPVASGKALAGHEALRAALDALPAPERGAVGPFRLPVDRAFLRPGFGAVVTGTVRSGSVRDGDELVVLPTGQRARLRGLQRDGQPVERAQAGDRAALNLAGIEHAELGRGLVVSHPEALPPTAVIDVELELLPSAPALDDGARLRLLLGTAEVMAVVQTISAPQPEAELGPPLFPGDRLLAQLRCEAPLVALDGDRFVLRRESPVETIGGGVVLDARAPRIRRRDLPRARAELLRLRAGDPSPLLDRAGALGLAEADPRAQQLPPGLGARLGDRRLAPAQLARHQRAVINALQAYHAAHPLRAGCPRREVRSAAVPELPERLFDALVQLLSDEGALVAEGPRLRLAGHTPDLDGPAGAALRRLTADLRAAGVTGPRLAELDAHPDLVQLLMESGVAVKVGDRLLHVEVTEQVKEAVRAHIRAAGGLSAQDCKALFDLSRQHAIPLLEWLDAQRVTMRTGDLRTLRGG
jgi:selenocysteine-specific elongation factor